MLGETDINGIAYAEQKMAFPLRKRLAPCPRGPVLEAHFVARLSIVIPVLRQLDRLEDTLISVLENRPPDCQIVVVLNEPYNDPYALSGEVCFIQAAAGSSFADVLNLGIVGQPLAGGPPFGVRGRGHARLDRRGAGPFRRSAGGRGGPAGAESFSAAAADFGRTCLWPGRGDQAARRGRDPDGLLESGDTLAAADILSGFYRKSAVELVGRFVQGTTTWRRPSIWPWRCVGPAIGACWSCAHGTCADPSWPRPKGGLPRLPGRATLLALGLRRGLLASLAAHAALLAFEGDTGDRSAVERGGAGWTVVGAFRGHGGASSAGRHGPCEAAEIGRTFFGRRISLSADASFASRRPRRIPRLRTGRPG